MFKTTILDRRAQFLAGHAYNTHSQFGEDGLINALFETIGAENRWCFEVGAADGVFFSNTRCLIQRGWSGLLIEADEQHFHKLAANYVQVPGVTCFNYRVTPNGFYGLDSLLAKANAPTDLDLGVIDIDGQDYWVWQGMTIYRPRVMLVEYSPYGEPTDLPEPGGAGQAGLDPICALGAEKGYTALCYTYCNVLFCLTTEWERIAAG